MDESVMDKAESTLENDFSPGQEDLDLRDLIQNIDEEILSGLRAGGGNEAFSEEKDLREYIGYYICFTLAGKPLAIPLTSVQEAGQLQVLQKLPLLPDWIPGITIIRGEIVSVVNLERFMGKERKKLAPVQPYLVIYGQDIKIAVTVDGIIGTRSLYRLQTDQSLQDSNVGLPDPLFAGRAAYQERGTEREISLFDVETFLSSQKLRNAATA
jgi:chemotaxis signal transduction protein